jgi:hypothetical protein
MSEVSVVDVSERAQKALQCSPILRLRDLRVVHLGHALLISGTVSSYYHKQLAQEVVRTVAEGLDVINSIDVTDAPN